MMSETSDESVQQWDGSDVPVERWGKDHWSTFAYIETRTVDHDGFVDDRHMRGHDSGWDKYPTRLRGGALLGGHNDFDCAHDAVMAGLLAYADPEAARPTSPHFERSLRGTWRGSRFAMTPLGSAVSGALRAHKSEGGKFATFDASGVLASATSGGTRTSPKAD